MCVKYSSKRPCSERKKKGGPVASRRKICDLTHHRVWQQAGHRPGCREVAAAFQKALKKQKQGQEKRCRRGAGLAQQLAHGRPALVLLGGLTRCCLLRHLPQACCCLLHLWPLALRTLLGLPSARRRHLLWLSPVISHNFTRDDKHFKTHTEISVKIVFVVAHVVEMIQTRWSKMGQPRVSAPKCSTCRSVLRSACEVHALLQCKPQKIDVHKESCCIPYFYLQYMSHALLPVYSPRMLCAQVR